MSKNNIFPVDNALKLAQKVLETWQVKPSLDPQSLEWIKQTWNLIIQAGLAEYKNDQDYLNVTIRCLALADFYLEFCQVVYRKKIELNYFSILKQENIKIENLSFDEIKTLLKNERQKILKTLLKNTEFLHNDLLFFLDLWDSLNLEQSDLIIIEKQRILANKNNIFKWFSEQIKQENKSNVVNFHPQINSYFEKEAFDLLERLSEQYRDYLKNHSSLDMFMNKDNQDQFYQYVFHPFINLCQSIAEQLPPEFQLQTDQDKEIIFSFQDASGQEWLGLQEYFTNSKLLYLKLTSRGIILGCNARKYQEVLAKIQQKNLQKFHQIIRKKPACFIPLDFSLNITKETILLKSESELIENIRDFFKQYITLVLFLSSDASLDYIINNLKVSKKNVNLDNIAEQFDLESSQVNDILKTIERKKQIILQGSPGTGKTFLAKYLAEYLTSNGDSFFELIQFHPSYAYEDFIQGIRPQTNTDGHLEYKMISGRFLEFCQQAEHCQDPCVLIIDEINRANLSQVFGELMYLLEYRDQEIKLAGTNQLFRIPNNIRIIGTMNTADRSIALVDHALRRRFAFITVRPNYNILRRYHQGIINNNLLIESLIKILQKLNKTINDPHYEIGISFFLIPNLAEDLGNIWQWEIEPYLEEYFFDQMDKIKDFRWDKIKDFVLKF